MARFRVRDVVDYHAVIGGPVTHPQMVVRVVMEEVSSLPLYWLEGKVGCVAEDALTVPDRDDTDLLRWAVEYAGMSSPSRAPRWSHVANLLGLGSTYAAAVCCRFNLDPDEVQGGCDCCREGQATVCRCNEGVYGLGAPESPTGTVTGGVAVEEPRRRRRLPGLRGRPHARASR